MFLSKNCKLIFKVQCWNQHAKLLQQKSSRLLHTIPVSSRVHCNIDNLPRFTRSLISVNKTSVYPKQFSTIKDSSHNHLNENPSIEDEEAERNKQNQKSWRMMKYSLIFLGASFSFATLSLIYDISQPDCDENGKVIEDEFSHLPQISQLYHRFVKKVTYYAKLIQEPSRDKLLPEPLSHPYIQPPYTVVLELTDVLVHPDWTYQTGWRFKKRPGIDHFLEAIAPPQFEIVIYTAEHGMTVFPIVDALDPHGYIMYRLVRDATRFVDGHHVKDLDALNRDLSKVIVIDWNAESVKFHPENTLKIPRWNGNDNDTTLYDLGAFLKTIYATQVEDVRDVLNYYRQFENPLEAFRENQRKLLSQLEKEESKIHKDETKILTSKWRPSFLKSF